ncbi:MAG: hypothetical protein ACXW3Z_08205 [Limisphaerales bacterium]
MKRKHLYLAIAALLAAGGLWFAQSGWRSEDSASGKSRTGTGFTSSSDRPQPGQMIKSPARLAPPDQTRRFRDLTPEQRVQQARKGHGPGG